jgi:plastocyanin
MRAGRSLLALIGLALLVAGCGGAEAAREPVATTKVTMAKSYRFDPGTIRVEAGATVTWTNDDNFTHTVRVDGQEDHKVEPGEHVSLSLAEPGTYHYVCTLHRQDMEGEVIVE